MSIRPLIWNRVGMGVWVAETPLKYNYRITYTPDIGYQTCGTNDPYHVFKTLEEAEEYWQNQFVSILMRSLYE